MVLRFKGLADILQYNHLQLSPHSDLKSAPAGAAEKRTKNEQKKRKPAENGSSPKRLRIWMCTAEIRGRSPARNIA
jgi:hypothetical protein